MRAENATRGTRRCAALAPLVVLAICFAAALPDSSAARQTGASGTPAQSPASQPRSETDSLARRKVEEALDALGGAARLEAITSILIKTEGREHSSSIAQGYQPEKEGTSATHEETIVAYPAQERFLYEQKTARGDGTYRLRRWAYTGDERTVVDFTERFATARRAESNRAERERRARRLPHLLLLEARKNAANLSSLTATDFQGRRHDRVDFRLPGEKSSVRLFLDAETRLLTKYEYTMDFPSYGDTIIEVVYAPYQRHERLGWFPSGDAIKVGGKVYREVRYNAVEVDSPRAAAQFELPDDLKAHVAAPGTVSEIARGVFLVNSLGNLSPVFVEFKDFVLAVEAPTHYYSFDTVPADPQQPGASSVSEEFIRKIKETVPGKPIRYLVVTHSHSDHAGGARAFIAEGASLLTTPGNRGFFERMAAATHALIPDRLSREPRPLRLETFDGRRVVTDGERTVELINVGANPHTEESIVVHLPRERIVYQGDLFYFDGEATFPPRNRRTVMPFFARWLIKNNLAPERIYGSHDRGFATMEHVRRVLAAPQKSEGAVKRQARARVRRTAMER